MKLAGAFVWAGAAVSLWAAQQPPQFRSSVETVAVYATVRDSHGQLARGLTQEDFELFDNGQRRDIVAFSNDLQPTTVAMVLDRSGSLNPEAGKVLSAAGAFVNKLLPGDRASMHTLFWDCQDLTDSKDDLLDAVGRLVPVDLGSPIWRAMDRVMTRLDSEGGRRALLIFSDGADTGFQSPPLRNLVKDTAPGKPCHVADYLADVSPLQVITHARQEGQLVYAISVRVPNSTVDDSDLKRIAKDSGGEAFVLKPGGDLTAAFTNIADELHHQYLLGFVPPVFDGIPHEITVRVKRSGYSVRARKMYIAAHDESGTPETEARAFADRRPWAELTSTDINLAIRDGAAGRTLQASCTAAAEFPSRFETRASVRITAEGPAGRVMRAAGEARARHQPFSEALVTPEMRAPVVVVTADLDAFGMGRATGDALPQALTAVTLRGRGTPPITLAPASIQSVPAGTRQLFQPGLRALFTMTDFKALPGADVEVIASSAAGDRHCRLVKSDVAAIR